MKTLRPPPSDGVCLCVWQVEPMYQYSSLAADALCRVPLRLVGLGVSVLETVHICTVDMWADGTV